MELLKKIKGAVTEPLETLDQVFADLDNIIKEIQAEDKVFQATVERIPSNMATMDHAPMEIALDNPLVTSLEEVTEEVNGKKSGIISFPGWTDASLLINFGNMDTVVFGPGDISCAHSEVEFIEISQLYPAYLIYALTAIKYCHLSE